ncbi:MAG: insulinase family protein [Crocinitomicaceae bacterium]|nr:insulinase family protein [Crocinitomicaceae bacterium]
MLNRKIQPEIKEISTIQFEKPLVFDITKDNKLFCMTNVQNETSKIELIFNAGSILGNAEIAAVVNELLLSGTKDKTSFQINEEIDRLGGFIGQAVTFESATFSIYALRENLLPIARIVKDVIENCVFNEQEMHQSLKARKQRLEISLAKVSTVAQRSFKQRFFNSSETYSRITNKEDIDAIQQKDLIKFHNKSYLNGLKKMILVGNFSQNEIDEFIDIFGTWVSGEKFEVENSFENIKGYSHIEKKDALQTAIRIGGTLFNRSHKDYNDFLILNTLLGDYFGSRLMKNIREDKGYTYGIGSMTVELNQTGYFLIATEVKKEVKDLALAEIKFEIDRLRTKLVPQEELDLVKNYLLGQLLKNADGPYSMMDLFISAEEFGLTLDYYNELIQSIHQITPTRIKELANQYLNWNQFTIISVG